MPTVSQSLIVPSRVAEGVPPVRTAGTEADPLFCLADVCRVLGNANPSQVGARLREGVERGLHIVETPSGMQQMVFVTERGLYRVILSSRAENAEKFQDWVCGEVLPSIRKHGSYPPPAVEEDHIVRACMESSRALQLVAETRRAQLELESKQAALEEQSGRALATAESALACASGNYGYCSVLGYLRTTGRRATYGEASRHGRAIASRCRKSGVAVKEIRDPRFGKVNIYPESVLEEYFASVGKDA